MAVTGVRPAQLAPEPSRRVRLLAWLTTTDHKKIGILYFVNLQIGALDMAFPRVNALSFWLLPVGGLTILSGFLAKGGAAAAGWTNFAPLSLQGGTGEDLWIAGLLIVGMASILGAINFIVTILRMRAPGISMMRMPIFCWSTLATSLL